MGGDEFLVIMPGANEDAVNQAMARLKSSIEQFNSVPNEVPLSLAVGTTVANTSESIPDCIREADEAMYANKKARRRSLSE